MHRQSGNLHDDHDAGTALAMVRLAALAQPLFAPSALASRTQLSISDTIKQCWNKRVSHNKHECNRSIQSLCWWNVFACRHHSVLAWPGHPGADNRNQCVQDGTVAFRLASQFVCNPFGCVNNSLRFTNNRDSCHLCYYAVVINLHNNIVIILTLLFPLFSPNGLDAFEFSRRATWKPSGNSRKKYSPNRVEMEASECMCPQYSLSTSLCFDLVVIAFKLWNHGQSESSRVAKTISRRSWQVLCVA